MIPKRVGLITIGQSPRVDVVPGMKEILGPDFEILEAGALDGLSLEEVKKFSPKKGDYILCTRMADGTQVVIGKRYILPRMQACIDLLIERGAEALLLLCTGKFPPFRSRRLLLEPQKILDHFLLALQGEKVRFGMMSPLKAQLPQTRKKYKRLKGTFSFFAASPYAAGDELGEAAIALRRKDPHVVVMNCMGYTPAMKKRVMEITGKPTVLANSLVARALAELLS
ncbi:MAG: AroM family protein [Syntrophaceae bacterium]|nr:AroM family protein [Syntrophaceae bacterium]